jgi:CheY-like chemotaxis protein
MPNSDLSIIVIDDNRDAAFTLGLLLKRSGFSVLEQIHDPALALDAVTRQQPHVVILDIAMPRLDGYELARRIRAELNPVPRLVAVTGMCTANDRHAAIAAGFDAHFAKPADWPILEALLFTYLQQRAADGAGALTSI